MLHTVGLFLKRAAEEIAAHGDGSNAAFGIDRTTLVTVLMQIAVELSATALVLKHEGFVGVTKPKDLPATDAEAKALGQEAKIRTINFEQIKPKAAKYLGDEAFWLNVDFLQRTRNKLVHFHAPIIEEDRFDLKYDAVQVLLQIIDGGSAGARTRDLSIKSRLLYRLSYGPPPSMHRALGLRWRAVNRAERWRIVRPLVGSRQSGAISASGASTNARIGSAACGTRSPGSAQIPPDHSRMSRSSARAPQRRPGRRPNRRSIRFSRASSSGGDSSVAISTAALAKRRIEGPSGAVLRIRDTAMMPPIASSAAASVAAGSPYRVRRLPPRPIA